MPTAPWSTVELPKVLWKVLKAAGVTAGLSLQSTFTSICTWFSQASCGVRQRRGWGWERRGTLRERSRPRPKEIPTGKHTFAVTGTTPGSLSSVQFSSAQLLSRVRLFVTPWTAACQAFLSITNSWSLLKFMSIESVMPFNYLILSSPYPPTFNLSQHQGLFQCVSSSHQILEFQLQHQSFQCWISLQSKDSQESSPTPQFKSINSSALSFFYSPTLTYIHDYWKTIVLTRQTFVGKVMSLLFNMLSRLVIAFLPRSKHLLILWLQSSSAVILESKKIVSHWY